MRVCVYATPAIIDRAGIGRFSRMVLTYLQDVAPEIEFIYYYYYFPLKNRGKRLAIERPNVRELFLPMPSRVFERVLLHFGMNHSLFYGKSDIFYSPDLKFPEVGDEIVINTIHDLCFMRFRDFFSQGMLSGLEKDIKKTIIRADHFITVSESTKRDFMEYFGISDERISVVYAGFEISDVEELESGLGDKGVCVDGDYILSAGTLNPRKNYEGLIKAYNILLDRGYAIRLVIAGRKGWMNEGVFSTIEELGLMDNVSIFTELNDENIAGLYRNAKLFVYPSFCEGFGLPPLEASAYNVPVACSGVSSLPEVMGDSALYFDPHNPEDIADKMEKLIVDSDLRAEMICRERENLKRFSWKKTATKIVKVFKEVYG
ncbi:MAG: hypothetical protein DRH49_01590 [Candidatus Coatesbacteria bacterium]|nr:MAG: hypothetical protein DRH49_01590 [Candidatus Coatesbacteria bacterium]